jgi:hypothetical protein
MKAYTVTMKDWDETSPSSAVCHNSYKEARMFVIKGYMEVYNRSFLEAAKGVSLKRAQQYDEWADKQKEPAHQGLDYVLESMKIKEVV